jgi:hypothetical protein
LQGEAYQVSQKIKTAQNDKMPLDRNIDTSPDHDDHKHLTNLDIALMKPNNMNK